MKTNCSIILKLQSNVIRKSNFCFSQISCALNLKFTGFKIFFGLFAGFMYKFGVCFSRSRGQKFQKVGPSAPTMVGASLVTKLRHDFFNCLTNTSTNKHKKFKDIFISHAQHLARFILSRDTLVFY